jgi:hypothetical protein
MQRNICMYNLLVTFEDKCEHIVGYIQGNVCTHYCLSARIHVYTLLEKCKEIRVQFLVICEKVRIQFFVMYKVT